MSTSTIVSEAGDSLSAERASAQNDEFAALEERVLRTVELLKAERGARADAEQNSTTLQQLLDEQSAQLAETEARVRALEQEREQVRARVERMMKQLDEVGS
jgi:chromosome segregation ATPase